MPDWQFCESLTNSCVENVGAAPPVRSRPDGTAKLQLACVTNERSSRSAHWTRTVQGFAAGTSIRTALTVGSEHATTIAVEFFAPEVPAELAPVVGQVYLELSYRMRSSRK
jgi:hypothetical protein